MNLTAITVCVHYSDFLCWSIPLNKSLFNRWLVVTSKEDKLTQQLCNTWDIECIVCDFMEEGVFNKYRGFNKALEVVNNEWVLFLDADIILPPQSKRVFDELNFNPQFIYGIDRINLYGLRDLVKYLNEPENLIEHHWLIKLELWKVGGRICQYYGSYGDKFEGWSPLGFFQLCHRNSFEKYPDNCVGYDHCDLVFSKSYHRSRRSLIPEIIGLHLMTDTEWGINWKGRKSKKLE